MNKTWAMPTARKGGCLNRNRSVLWWAELIYMSPQHQWGTIDCFWQAEEVGRHHKAWVSMNEEFQVDKRRTILLEEGIALGKDRVVITTSIESSVSIRNTWCVLFSLIFHSCPIRQVRKLRLGVVNLPIVTLVASGKVGSSYPDFLWCQGLHC